jgi:hypothetical protein
MTKRVLDCGNFFFIRKMAKRICGDAKNKKTKRQKKLPKKVIWSSANTMKPRRNAITTIAMIAAVTPIPI